MAVCITRRWDRAADHPLGGRMHRAICCAARPAARNAVTRARPSCSKLG
jgi:hypothetical protein